MNTRVALLLFLTLLASCNASYTSTEPPKNSPSYENGLTTVGTCQNNTCQLWVVTWEQSPVTVPRNASCEFCEIIVELIDHDVKSANETLHVIEEFVDLLCKVIDPIVEPACKTVLDDIQEIFNWIVNGTVPTNEICTKLGLCPA